MNKILQVGDQLICPNSGDSWTVRSALPGRLRLVNKQLRENKTSRANLQLVVADHPEVAHLRINLQAGSLLLEHEQLIPWRRRAVEELLDQAQAENSEQLLPAVPLAQPPRAAFFRLLLAAMLLLGQLFLAEVWLLPLGLLILPPLLLPLLLGLGKELKKGALPTESLDLVWFSTLIARGELGGLATELALENGNKLLQGELNQGDTYGEDLCQELRRWQEQSRFRLAPPEKGEKQLTELKVGDRIQLRQGEVVPLDGYVVSGEAMVSKRLLDGETALIPVRAFQPLPLGVELIQGEVTFKLNQSLAEQPIYQELLHLNEHHPAPWGIQRARSLHRQLLPVVLGGGLLALGLGRPHAAAGLMQFDPINDWQLSASIAYRGARQLCLGWGVILRRGAVLDRLAKCRTLVISEGAICYGINRSVLEIRSLDADHNAEALVELVAGFRRFMHPEAIPLYPLQTVLQERDLEPRQVEQLQPVGGCGLQGVVGGQRVHLGGGALLGKLGIKRPSCMGQTQGLHWLFVLVEGEVVGGLLYQDQLDRQVLRSLRRLRRNGWRLHLVSTWHGDTLDSIARQLELPPQSMHPSVDLAQRMELIRSFDRQEGPIAYLGSSLMDSGAFAAADIGIAVSDGTFALPIEMADIVVPAKRLDRLVDCVAVAEDIGANNRQNFYLVLLPHSAALLLSVLLLLDPLLAVLLADVPLVLVELNNLQTFQHLRQEHKLGWKAQRKRTSRRRPATRAPEGESRKQASGKG